jgi:tetratricopeptide (TPR) repeat protein
LVTRAAWLCVVICALAGPAAAQSKRYPPRQVDHDAEAAHKSDLWNAAVNPERHPYQDLVHAAKEALNQRTFDQTSIAIGKLDEAVKLLPREPEAYRLRGDAYYERREWALCASDFAAAEANTQHDDEPPHVMADLRRKLGVCQAHAGKLAEAEQTLTETVTSAALAGGGAGETWMRLGEVRIALGKLDEAIAALRSALDSTESGATAMTRFLLAEAYDRARRPADAMIEATEAVRLDHALSLLFNPAMPALGNGDYDYMLGLAFAVEPARPEFSLAYFRRYAQSAPDSPWRKRAEEHLREIKPQAFPETVSHTGTAPLDPELVRTAARKVMPQLRACLGRLPTAVVEVEIVKSGPRTPSTDRTRPHVFMQPDGVVVHRAVGELSDDELGAVEACMRPFATKIAMPAVKDRDTYYKASFYVAAP